MNLFFGIQAIYLLVGTTFCLVGLLASRSRRRRGEHLEIARSRAAAIILETDPQKLDMHYREIERLPRPILASLLQHLLTDTTGDAEQRLRKVAEAKGLSTWVARRSRRRAWKRRIQAAYLLALLQPKSDDVVRLINDKHPLVRARSIDSLGPAGAALHCELLVHAIQDPNQSVRLAVQQALLRAGLEAVPHITSSLQRSAEADPTPDHVVNLLQVASAIPDPELVHAMVPFGSSADPRLRSLVATSLGGGLHLTPSELLGELVDDPDGGVRSEAARAVGQAQVMGLAPKLGRMLSDEHWQVRREAGAALAAIGAPGSVVLRTHLTDDDPFARDMAQFVIGQMEELGALV